MTLVSIRVPNLDEYMGTKIETKVIELNRSRNNVVLSRRAVLEEERKEQRQEILDRLQPGLIVEGQISNIVDFGAFVEILDGVEGLVHISELANHHVENPREVVAQGDVVPVLILEVDAERRRLSLSLKRVDPERRAENEAPIEGTPHLDLSEDVFSDATPAPPLPGEEEAVEREAVNVGDEVDPAAADEVAAAEPAPPDEH